MRGQKLFNELMNAGLAETVKRGRSDELNNDRNICLAARYYYYGHLKERRYDECMTLLVKEFFISASRISRILQDYAERITEMKAQKITVYKLTQAWPHLKWAQ